MGKRRKVKLPRKNLDVISEILQISLFLFIISLTIAYPLSYVFTKFDDMLTSELEKNNLNDTSYKVIKYIETFFQLFISAVLYHYIEEFLYKIPIFSANVRTFNTYRTASYALHIVMIVLIIELNTSLVNNLHYIAESNPFLDGH